VDSGGGRKAHNFEKKGGYYMSRGVVTKLRSEISQEQTQFKKKEATCGKGSDI